MSGKQSETTESRIATGSSSTVKSSNLEAAKLLLDEWKWQREHRWNALRQYAIAAVLVSIVPYAKTDLVPILGCFVMIFPLVGWLIFFVAGGLFAFDYVRDAPVREKYRLLLGEFAPNESIDESKRKQLEKAIWITIWLFSWAVGQLSVLNAMILNELLTRSKPPSHAFGNPLFSTVLIIVSIIQGFGLLWLSMRLKPKAEPHSGIMRAFDHCP
jgi:hypothetical protein